jgi:hypothetical protein
MQRHIFLAVVWILALIPALAQGSSTKISFFVEHEVDLPKDYL